MCNHRLGHVLNGVGVRYVCLFEGMVSLECAEDTRVFICLGRKIERSSVAPHPCVRAATSVIEN
jgi:hypothetical protein